MDDNIVYTNPLPPPPLFQTDLCFARASPTQQETVLKQSDTGSPSPHLMGERVAVRGNRSSTFSGSPLTTTALPVAPASWRAAALCRFLRDRLISFRLTKLPILWLLVFLLAGDFILLRAGDSTAPTIPSSPQWLRDGVIYEIFPRHFSAAGNLDGVTARLDELKTLGVNIIWLMPIHPIGTKFRKGDFGSPYRFATTTPSIPITARSTISKSSLQKPTSAI